jgi:hypothetical protein
LRRRLGLLVRVGGYLGRIRMRRLSISLMVIFGLFLMACGSSDASDQIHGMWIADSNVYVSLDADDEWSAREGVEGSEFDWGTYTFEDGVLTMSNAEDSYCSGATNVSNGSFEENGDELHLDFVSDTCTKPTGRAVDQVWVRHTP